jgi:mRNA interferase HigB
MVILSYSSIRDYTKQNPKVGISLLDWYGKTKKAQWSTITDVRDTFGYADYVGDERFVFNIHGNHYRLVAAVSFEKRTVYIKFIGTHEEYEKINVLTVNQF